jgi:hypothetical protein
MFASQAAAYRSANMVHKELAADTTTTGAGIYGCFFVFRLNYNLAAYI